jgi:hypothetical protein
LIQNIKKHTVTTIEIKLTGADIIAALKASKRIPIETDLVKVFFVIPGEGHYQGENMEITERDPVHLYIENTKVEKL